MAKVVNTSEIYKILDLEDLQGEEWRDIKGYEGRYAVSCLGRIKALKRHCNSFRDGKIVRYNYKPQIMKPSVKGKGYLSVSLSKNKIKEQKYVHRIVAKCFILNTGNKPQVNHKNGIKTDNSVENLEWVTSSENLRHAISTGLRVFKNGENHHAAKIEDKTVLKIKHMLINSNLSIIEIAKFFCVSPNRVSKINNGYTHSKLTGYKGVPFRQTRKLNEDIAKAIINKIKQGAKTICIANEFNVSSSTINDVKNGRIYKGSVLTLTQ